MNSGYGSFNFSIQHCTPRDYYYNRTYRSQLPFSCQSREDPIVIAFVAFEGAKFDTFNLRNYANREGSFNVNKGDVCKKISAIIRCFSHRFLPYDDFITNGKIFALSVYFICQ